jgi:hypothetical protein
VRPRGGRPSCHRQRTAVIRRQGRRWWWWPRRATERVFPRTHRKLSPRGPALVYPHQFIHEWITASCRIGRIDLPRSPARRRGRGDSVAPQGGPPHRPHLGRRPPNDPSRVGVPRFRQAAGVTSLSDLEANRSCVGRRMNDQTADVELGKSRPSSSISRSGR